MFAGDRIKSRMADISLRDYLAKLDTLLKSGSAAEVILHCRHILQYFPKDAQAYRLMGQALVATSRWQEAGEVMRRVLSVYPDDREAHAGLSEVYRIEKRPDDAIWHLERAFEQTPNDHVILDNLRELYRKYRKTEHGKVQLTAAAVARQYMRNGLYEQAIDTLQKARTASPERMDLPLLLAQTYWDRGQRVEAAETALEVLKVLPDCLVANTLLAAMWLTEARPSDAQRYIGRIESLDPYLALELAQGQDVPDNAFKLPELDYELAAQREMNLQTPDWLGMTGNSENLLPTEDEDPNAVPDFFNDITANEDMLAKQSFDVPLTSADWANTSDDLPAVADDSSPTIRKPTGPLTGLAGRFGKTSTGSLPTDAPPKSNVPGAKRGLTGRLTPLPEEMPEPEPISTDFFSSFMDEVDAASTDDVTSLDQTGNIYTSDLPDLEDLLPDATLAEEDLPFRRERTTQPEDNDPLAWLRSTGVEIDEEAPARSDDEDLYDADSDNLALHEADAADPLSWLQGYGSDNLVIEQDVPQVGNGTDNLPLPEDQAGDPMAWLQATEPAPSAKSTPDSAVTSSGNEDPLDWLSDDSLLDEAFDLESLVNNQSSLPEQPSYQADVSSTAATPEWQDTMADEKDPLDWLSSESEPEAEPTDSFTWMEDASTTAADSSEDFPSWLNASASNSEIVDGGGEGSENDIDWMTDLPDLVASEPVEEPPSATTGMLDWLGKEKVDAPDMPSMEQMNSDAPDWLSEVKTEPPSASASSQIDENGFEWMSTADELPPVPSVSDVPDWLSSMDINLEPEDESEPIAADDSDWMSSMEPSSQPAEEDEPLGIADTPDWLSSMEPEEPEAEPFAAADTPDWLSSMEPTLEPIQEDEPEPLAAADTPDWLSSMEPEDEPVEEDEPLGIADTPDWLSSMEPEDEPEPLAAADTPDWLSSMDFDEEPQAEPEPLTAATDQPDWLNDLQPDEPEAEPIAAADTPDWLSAMEPEAQQNEPEPIAAADAPDWLSSMDFDEEPQAEPEPLTAATDQPDWLNDLQPDEPEAEPIAAADAPDWLSAMEPDEPEAEPEPLAAADTPDWLSSMDFNEEPQVEAEPLTAATDQPDWLNDLQPDEPEVEPIAAADAPDWLSSMDFDEEPQAEPEPLAAIDQPDWLNDLQPDEPEPLAAADTPDWLSGIGDVSEAQQDEPEPLAAADTPDWLSAMEPEAEQDEPEPLAAADAPDWLSSMEPEPEAEPEPLAAADTPDWLSAMEPDEPEAEPEPLAAADAPDWLSSMEPEAEQDDPEPLATADTPDWLTSMDIGDQSYAEPEPLPVTDAPDWLSAMQPEDEQQDEPEPLAIADAPDWLSAMQPEDEPDAEPITDAVSNDTPDWLSAMQEPTEDQPASSEDQGMRVTPTDMNNWLDDMPVPEADAEQPMNDEEWTETAEQAPEMTADVPDWLTAMNTTSSNTPTNGENNDSYQWDDVPAEESMPAAPAPASNAPDWLNAMVPGLDVDYEAPEDKQVETEFLPTNKETSTPSAPAKESKVRPEFGWLLDIVSEESQQVTVVADKTALRRFVFSKLPAWLRKPTEQSDNSPANESEADNVDIPPWLQ